MTTIQIDPTDPAKGFGAGVSITSNIAEHGQAGIDVANNLRESLANSGARIDAPTVTDSVVAFSVLLTPPNQSFCLPPGSSVASTNAGCKAWEAAYPDGSCAKVCNEGFRNGATSCERITCPAGQSPDQDGYCTTTAPATQIATNTAADVLAPSANQLPPADTTPVWVCHDEYGDTCAQDFGGMCTEDWVREMCKKYCGVCVDPSDTAFQQAAAVTPAVPEQSVPDQSVPDTMVAGTAPGAPLLPKIVATTVFPSQREIYRSADEWLNMVNGTNPDGSPLRIVDIQVDPAFGTFRQRSEYSIVDFANPGVKAEAYVEVTFENSAGRNTARILIRTGPGW